MVCSPNILPLPESATVGQYSLYTLLILEASHCWRIWRLCETVCICNVYVMAANVARLHHVVSVALLTRYIRRNSESLNLRERHHFRLPVTQYFYHMLFLLANVNSRSRSLFAVARPSVVCLSVGNAPDPTQAVVIFFNFYGVWYIGLGKT